MPSTTVLDVISDLQKFYNKKLTGVQLKFYGNQLAKMNEDDLCKGAIAIKRRETIFPVIAMIERYVIDAREFRLEREKEQTPTFDYLEKNNQRTENGRMAIAMMRDLHEGKNTREEFLAAMFEMEKKFPDIGWKENAEELKQFWLAEKERHTKGRRYLERIYNESDEHNGRKP